MEDTVGAYIADETTTELLSFIGHQKTVDAINKDLGISLEVSREKAEPVNGDMIVVASFDLLEDLERGARLDEDELVKLPISYMFIGRVNPVYTHTYW